MPVTFPTPEEFLHLPWHKRDRAIRAARGLLRQYGGMVEEAVVPPARTRLSAEALRQRHWEFGEAIRAEARRLEQGA